MWRNLYKITLKIIDKIKVFIALLGEIKNIKKRKGLVKDMKKSTLLSLIIILSALIGAVSAMYIYLMKREKELDEYERILFEGDITAQDAELAQLAE